MIKSKLIGEVDEMVLNRLRWVTNVQFAIIFLLLACLGGVAYQNYAYQKNNNDSLKQLSDDISQTREDIDHLSKFGPSY